MKRILVCSDIHGYIDNFKAALEKTENPDAIIIAGDLCTPMRDLLAVARETPVYAVKGNNDFNSDLPYSLNLTIAGHQIFVTHGHRYDVPCLGRLQQKAEQERADIVIFGHTHKLMDTSDGSRRYLNPGALFGFSGFGICSFMIMTLKDSGEIDIVTEKI